MDSISPLAKILAEANGIDWRSIQGSGAGGSIVEQDILNYLSRVMSGDEEPPATPVDEAPPGWTGVMPPMPAAVAASGLQALSAAGVDTDITDFVAQQSQSGQVSAPPMPTPPVPTPPAQPQPVQPQATVDAQFDQSTFAQPPVIQPPVIQPPVTQSSFDQPSFNQPTADASLTTVYRPSESAATPVQPPVIGLENSAPTQFLAQAAPMQPPVQPSLQPVDAAPAPLPPALTPFMPAPVPPTPEYEFGEEGDFSSDLDFELDDDSAEDHQPEIHPPQVGGSEHSPTDSAPAWNTQGESGVSGGSLSLPIQPAPVVEPVAPSHTAHQDHAAHQETLAAREPAEYGDVQAVEPPAYDPVALDTEAPFLLADALPAVGTDATDIGTAASSASTDAGTDAPTTVDSVPVVAAPPVPEPFVEDQAAQARPVQVPQPAQGGSSLQEGGTAVAASASGFGLGSFLSRLYGPGTAATPAIQPVVSEAQADPLPVPPVFPASSSELEPETLSDPARSEPYMPSFGSVSDQTSGEAEAPRGSPLLGEPLVSQAPPIPDTPVAAPLVADQWRDQPEQTEDTDYSAAQHPAAEAEVTAQAGQDAATPDLPDLGAAAPQHDPFMLGSSPVADQELISAESDHAEVEAPPAELGQPIALPEAHEGGVEHDLRHAEPSESGTVQSTPAQSESGQSEPVQSEPVAQNWTALVEPHAEQAEQPHDAASELPAHGTEAVGSESAENDPVVSDPVASDPVASQPVDVQPLQSQPSDSQAITLRLNVDLGLLEVARAQLSEALYREVPLSLLVARAAARSLASLGLHASGGVALADHAGQPLGADLSADFRASLDGLGQPAQTSPALLVLDAAELGLDELHRGECSLSVGRAGAGANALSLRGNLDPVRGAKFLHEVAALLDTPILLLF